MQNLIQVQSLNMQQQMMGGGMPGMPGGMGNVGGVLIDNRFSSNAMQQQ